VKNYVIVAEGLAELERLSDVPDEIVMSARQALNKAIDRARTHAAAEMRSQVDFPARYLTGADGRLRITKRAVGNDLEAIIVGRHRPTSLARFLKGNPTAKQVRRRGGASVQVKPGMATFMKGTFLVRLRAGNQLTDTKHNLGLAIRLKPGESLRNKKQQGVQLGNNVYLLYGPSVDQVFRTVAGDMTPEAIRFFESEFNRLRVLKGI